MIVRGHLLRDPAAPPEFGWLRISEGRIVETGLGDAAPDSSADGPTFGGPGRVICPGFVDAHTHAPQIDEIGCDGMSLLEWLERVVFPAEIWWGRGAARETTRRAVKRMLKEGTTGFAGYLTSHGRATQEALALLAGPPRMRFVAGRVAMDRNAPDELTAEDRWRAQQRPTPSVAAPFEAAGRRGEVSVNPRFAVSCSDELLAEVGWLLRERPETMMQTHVAETPEEVALVREIFPGDAHYTGVYERHGLLTPRTLLAHGLHLSDQEWRLISERGSVVVHCPSANLFLGAGLFDLAAARRHGVRLALGSDVAAGPDVAMPRVARAAIDVAKARRLAGGAKAAVPSPGEVWRMITAGNAAALGWDDHGALATGDAADLLVLRPPDAWRDPRLAGRLIYNWSADLIETRIVDGVVVSPDTI